ncbi:hypothetical protein C8Q75DRAFT_523740 [Abortiporus biennis]|nr:hypothetical protein C8Q75DRAFT_523740 [Abortiporus biennis]
MNTTLEHPLPVKKPLSLSAAAMATLAKLTSQSTQTLSLLLERQRLQTLSTGPNTNSLHLPQIKRNLNQLRKGILQFEEKEGSSEAIKLLKSQYERMRSMLGVEAETAGIESLEIVAPAAAVPSPVASTSSLEPLKSTDSPPQPPTPPLHPQSQPHSTNYNSNTDGPFAPYTDDPEAGYNVPHDHILVQQRQVMDQQDVHLDRLSQSVNRQRDISLQINDELDVHTGLLEGLDTDLDMTGSRLSGARRRLERVAKGAKENGSTVMIGLLILVLLILIIIFKT